MGSLAAILIVLQSVLFAGAAPVLPSPPVIQEPFTLLPCSKTTTIGMEGCQEHKIVKLDRVIDQAEQVLFAVVSANAARFGGAGYQEDVEQDLIDAQTAWSAFRLAECRSESDVEFGGTGAPLVSGSCELAMSKARLAQLKTLYAALKTGQAHVPAFPKA